MERVVPPPPLHRDSGFRRNHPNRQQSP